MKLPVLSNRIENRLITLVSMVFTIVCMYLIYQFGILPAQKLTLKMVVEQNDKQNKANMELIEALAKDPRYSIQNDFSKIKAKENSNINLNLDNKIQLDTLRINKPTQPSGQVEKKNIFRKNTSSQKKIEQRFLVPGTQ